VAAYTYGQVVRSLSLVCPVLDYVGTFLKPSTKWASDVFDEGRVAQAMVDGCLDIGDDFLLDSKVLFEMTLGHPVCLLQSISQPTLVIHGIADSMVPFELSRRHCAGLRHVRLEPFENTDHGFTVIGDDLGTDVQSRTKPHKDVGVDCATRPGEHGKVSGRIHPTALIDVPYRHFQGGREPHGIAYRVYVRRR